MNDMHFRRDGALAATDINNEVGGPLKRGPARGMPLLTQYFAIVRRRKWVILGAILASLILGMVLTLLMTPQYTATSTIEIQRESFNIVKVDGVEPESNTVDLEFYQTQYGLLRAQSLAERIATELRLTESEEFFRLMGSDEVDNLFESGRAKIDAASRRARLKEAADLLLENVTIAPVRMSRLVDISFTSPDAGLSARVADAWASHFIESNLERRFEATSYARNFLQQRLEQLRGKLDESERLLVAYATNQSIINLPSGSPTEGGVTSERPLLADDLTAINQALADATSDRVRAESRLRSSGGSVSEALENNAISGLRQRRAELAGEYSKMLVQFEPQYPPARALASQIQQLDLAIGREESRVKSSLQESYRASVEREANLKQRVGGLKSDLLDLRRRSIQYNIYQRDVDTNRELYDGLLQRYKEIGVAGGVGVNNIAVVDKAQIPAKPSSPNLVLNLLLALLAGTILGAGLALALEQIDEAITDPSSVEHSLGLPLLGTIPKVSDADPVDSLQDRKSPVSEAYLSVQTNLAFSTDHGVPRSLAITSTRPSEGKTTTSFAIASSLARTGRRVILVDGDMRSPSIHKVLGTANDKGFSNYLTGEDDLDSLVTAGPNGLAVMAAGPQPPNAAELLTSERLQKIIHDLQDKYDHVVFDAPPVMGLADAPLLGSQVEGVVFVIESHGTRESMARVAIGRLQSAQVHLIGTVLTKFESKRAHYGYGYDYGYSYGESAKAEA